MRQSTLCDFPDSAPLFPPEYQTPSSFPSNDEEIEERSIKRINPNAKTPAQLNTELRLAIENNTWHPDDLINYYEGLGVEIKSVQGIVGLHDARQKNHCQFFTPLWVSKLITDLLNIPENATVLDNAMGTGRLAWHLPGKKLFTGIENESTAYEIARRIYPASCIIQDNLINHVVDDKFDYVLLNPPFSLNLKSFHGNLIHISYGGGILSHIAAIEIGLRAVKEHGYLAAILPDNIWKLESTRVLHRWIKNNSKEIAIIRLPKSTFAGTEWRTSLYIFQKQTGWYLNKNEDPFLDEMHEKEDITQVLSRFRGSIFNHEILDYARTRDSHEPVIFEKFREEEKQKTRLINKRKIEWNDEKPKVIVTAVRNKLHFIPNNALAAIKIENIKAHFGLEYDHSLHDYIDSLRKALNLDDAWANGKDPGNLDIFSYFKQYDLGFEFSPALLNWLEKKRRFFKRENTAFEQWIKPGEETGWETRFTEEGIRSSHLGSYKEQGKKFEKCCKEFPHLKILYDFQKDDLLRLSLKKKAIVAWQQGLGKTKLGIALAILKGCKRNLFIVPSHLKDTWLKEFRNFNITPHVIEKKQDLGTFSRFNLITYNALKKKVNPWETKLKPDRRSGKLIDKAKIFADVLKKRFKLIIADEAHYLSNKTTRQTKAAAKMKPRYLYLMTGTPIGNTVKNVYSLLDIGWKSGSPFFPYNTRQFREQFVSVEWVTPEFDDTLSKGRTAQQMADVKDVEGFTELMKTKWLRRVKAEPEVQQCIAIPKPDIVDITCKPEKEQLLHYKKHLEEFAVIFKKYMHPEEGKEHKVDQSIVLAMIQNLQFCSIIPQHPKVNPDPDFSYTGDKTATQKKILALIKKHYAEGKKIILFTQRPDFCDLLESW